MATLKKAKSFLASLFLRFLQLLTVMKFISYWKSLWRDWNSETIVISIAIWIMIELELCVAHQHVQDYVRPFVDLELMISQSIAVIACFLAGLFLERKERIAATALTVQASNQTATNSPPPSVPQNLAPAAVLLAQSERNLNLLLSEIPKVPIFFGSAALISAASTAAVAVFAASRTGHWHVFTPALSMLVESGVLFAFARCLGGYSITWIIVTFLLGAIFTSVQLFI